MIVCKCSSCQKDLGIYDPRSAWLKILHYFEIELMQDEITEATYGILLDALQEIEPDDKTN